MPKKNLRLVKGKPLFAYTIEAAADSTVVDMAYLSSDDDEILKLGLAMGAHVLKRPDQAATDTATADDVVSHFIGQLPHELVNEDPYLVYLQPTSPLRTSAHIDNAFKEMASKDGNMVMSVVKLDKTPYKAFSLDSTGLLKSIFSEKHSNANRQDLPVVYYPNGAIYIFQLSEFIKRGYFPSDGSVPFVMAEAESLDIDSEEDILIFEQRLGHANG